MDLSQLITEHIKIILLDLSPLVGEWQAFTNSAVSMIL